MVIEPDPTRRDVTERILAQGRFAVAPVVSAAGALALCPLLRPAVIVCPPADVSRLAEALSESDALVVTHPTGPDSELVAQIRLAIRERRFRRG
jgi:hypothetical protein